MDENPYEGPEPCEDNRVDHELRRHLLVLRITFWLSLAMWQVSVICVDGTGGIVLGVVFLVFAIIAGGLRRWLKALD